MHTSLSQFVPAAFMPDVDVTALTDLYLDSRDVTVGSAFVALNGSQVDGAKYLGNAFENGAKVAFVEKGAVDDINPWRERVVQIPDLASHLSTMAADFYGHPSASMATIAVTGTNGKTSVCRFVARALSSLLGPCGYIGTLGWGIDAYQPLINTTPDVVSMHRLLAKLKQASARSVALEASSIGIHQGRLDDVVIDVAVFTNLTRDHLDYHGDFEAYADVKRQLFMRPGLHAAIMNADDEVGASWIDSLRRDCKVITYGIETPADVSLLAAQYRLNGTYLHLTTPFGDVRVDVPVVGEYNAHNILATCAVLCHYSDDAEKIELALNQLNGVPGRMELIGDGAPAVLVDYAHTPDGLESALKALRPHCKGRLIVVFGCGGDRDKGKRPLMANVAESLADVLIVTSDNPRSEDPDVIIGEVLSGLSHPYKATALADRRQAIAAAIRLAEKEDCVLIAGKGHEDYQVIGDQRFAFDDRVVAAECLLEVSQ